MRPAPPDPGAPALEPPPEPARGGGPLGWSRRAVVGGGLGALAGLALPRGAAALSARLDTRVHDELGAGGWTVVDPAAGGTVTLRKKLLSTVGRTAWQGERDLDPRLSGAAFYRVLADVEGHQRFVPGLAASVVFEQAGDHAAFYQVLKAPAYTPVADRFWVSEARGWREMAGDPRRFRRAWSSQPAPAHAAARAEVLARFPGAVEVGFTHGTWEVSGAPNGGLHVIFSVVSDPGGALPKGMAGAVAGHNIPETIRTMEQEALRRG